MKRPILVTAVWGLVLYLGLFPGFALLHAYSQDELADPHGCVIGAWVQHANATDPLAAPPVLLPCLIGFVETSSDTTLHKALPSATSRGPPSRAS